jgi:FlaA1/EpsC-like NDP-sugar epimerase
MKNLMVWMMQRGKRSFFLVADIVFLASAAYLAFLLRFEGHIPAYYWTKLWGFLGLALPLKIFIFYFQRLYHISWSQVSIVELLAVFKGATYSLLILGSLLFLLSLESPIFSGFPRSILFIDYLLTLILIGGLRATQRVYREAFRSVRRQGKKVFIVGAGRAGEQLVRSILAEQNSGYCPVGFIDDDPAKQGTMIHGLPILGSRAKLASLAKEYAVEEVLIAIPSASAAVIRETVKLAQQAQIQSVKIVPYIHELLSGRATLAEVRNVEPEDLLGREPIRIKTSAIEAYLKGQVVLVTGAAGSIGSELCRQIQRFRPQKLIALDQDETGLFNLEEELAQHALGVKRAVVIADVRETKKIDQLFVRFRPQIIFHVAAYKHVPLMEDHPDEAVKTNVFGTLTVAKAALRHNVQRFILISTDKAVNPRSVMGATKRVAEMIVQALGDSGRTRFCAVRFGNVLGSRGSVLPQFKKQIKHRGPIKITHPEMKRYLMTAGEATLLVLQAGALGQGGEVLILDMGPPVSIVELAKELIRLYGYEPDRDIPIVFTGLRAGEKLIEELCMPQETLKTGHDKIFTVRTNLPLRGEEFFTRLDRLKRLAEGSEHEAITLALRELVPEYQPALKS